MKVLIVSDTHRKNELYVKLCQELAPLDMVIHCGDIEGSEYIINEAARCPVKMVAGNNDFFSFLNKELERASIAKVLNKAIGKDVEFEVTSASDVHSSQKKRVDLRKIIQMEIETED